MACASRVRARKKHLQLRASTIKLLDQVSGVQGAGSDDFCPHQGNITLDVRVVAMSSSSWRC